MDATGYHSMGNTLAATTSGAFLIYHLRNFGALTKRPALMERFMSPVYKQTMKAIPWPLPSNANLRPGEGLKLLRMRSHFYLGLTATVSFGYHFYEDLTESSTLGVKRLDLDTARNFF